MRRLPRGLLLCVLLGALMLRVIVPQGWMPIATGTGWHIAPCSGTGPMEMAADHHRAGHQAPAHPDGDGGHGCAFASLALALHEPPLPSLAPPPPPAPLIAARISPAVGIGRGLAAPPPPATGPPLA